MLNPNNQLRKIDKGQQQQCNGGKNFRDESKG